MNKSALAAAVFFAFCLTIVGLCAIFKGNDVGIRTTSGETEIRVGGGAAGR